MSYPNIDSNVNTNISPRTPSLSSAVSMNGLDSRSTSRPGTPVLLRKASTSSLHSSSGAGGSSSMARSSRSASSSHHRPTMRSPLRREASSEQLGSSATSLTEEAIARAHFAAELDAHHQPGTPPTRPTDLVVILHDACYGHRFARPRTSRAALATIVERPERVKAAVLGVAAAYVRLGGRHMDASDAALTAPHPHRNPAAILSIPFRIQKSTRRLALTAPAVTNIHGTKWMEELRAMCESAEARLAMGGKELTCPDGAGEKLHEGDLYLCAESLEALEGALGGVCDAVDAVFSCSSNGDYSSATPTTTPSPPQQEGGGLGLVSGPRRAFVAVRPPGHHCSAANPSGFCWVNNVHVGIMHAVLSHGLTHAAILDFDLHHGDGSQAIAWAHNARSHATAKNAAWWKKTSIGYFSLHDINSYPCEMGDEDKIKNASLCIDGGAHGQAVWNVHLQPWTTEAEFWALYESRYAVLLDKTREYLRGRTERLRTAGLHAKAAIFLSAGFDASEWESPGMQRHHANVPTEFYARIARDVVRIAAEEGTSVEGRIISVLEGGYSDRAIYSGVLSHLSGLAGDDPVVASTVAISASSALSASHDHDDYSNGLGYEMGQRMGALSLQTPPPQHHPLRARKDSAASKRGGRPYDSSWWNLSALESLEAIVTPRPSGADQAVKKKVRTNLPATRYSSPTQSSAAKIVTTPRGPRRSTSSLSPASRSPSPPPPGVSWTVATHELSKLLVPTDRTTDSCRAEDLAAEATRARRERQATATAALERPPTRQATAAPSGGGATRMSLRERVPKTYLYEDDLDSPLKEPKGSRRRKTVAEAAASAGSRAAPRQSGRRLSSATTTTTSITTTPESDTSIAKTSPPIRATLSTTTSMAGSAQPGRLARPDTAQSMRHGLNGGDVSGASSVAGRPLTVRKARALVASKKEPATAAAGSAAAASIASSVRTARGGGGGGAVAKKLRTTSGAPVSSGPSRAGRTTESPPLAGRGSDDGGVDALTG